MRPKLTERSERKFAGRINPPRILGDLEGKTWTQKQKLKMFW